MPSAERTATLATLPESVVFQVGRIDRATGRKVEVDAGAPSVLYLGGSQYSLYGTVRHTGEHFACGHYVAVVNVGGGPGAWVCFDDEKHYRVNAAFAKQSRSSDLGVDAPYLLFYRRECSAAGARTALAPAEPPAAPKALSDFAGVPATPTNEGARGQIPPKASAANVQFENGGGGGPRAIRVTATPGNAAQSTMEGDGCGAGVLFKCHGACGLALPRASFSRTQLGRKRDARRCRTCADALSGAGVAGGRGQTGLNEGTHKGLFSGVPADSVEPSVGGGGGGGVGVTLQCNGPCREILPRGSFSVTQAQRGADVRICSTCANLTEFDHPSAFRRNGACGRMLQKEAFTRKQFRLGSEARICTECRALLKCNGPCARLLSKDSFTKEQVRMDKGRRRCEECGRLPGRPINVVDTEPQSKLPQSTIDPQAAKGLLAVCQILPSDDSATLNALRVAMGQLPVADSRTADYAAVIGELKGGAAGSQVEHGGLLYAQNGKGELLVSRKGEWYTVPTDPRRKLDLLKSAHLASMHGSWHALDVELQLRRVYWQYLHFDCMFIVKKCDDCQLRKGKSKEDEVPPMTTGARALECNDLASIDLKTLPSGKQMCLVVDYLSHHIEGDILEDKTSAGVARFLYRLFLRNDPPTCILSDNGGEFRNQVAAECKSEWKIGRRFIAPAHPCANGLTERMNGVVADFVAKLGRDLSTLEDNFHEALAVYNRKHCPAIGCAPNAIWFGRQSRMAIVDLALEDDVGYTTEQLLGAVRDWEENPDWGSAVERIKARRDVLLNAALEKQARADLGSKLAFDRRNAASLNTFIPGEYVKVEISQYSAKMKGRLTMRSKGPFRVLRNWGNHLFLEGVEKSVPLFLCSRFYHDVCPVGGDGEESELEAGEWGTTGGPAGGGAMQPEAPAAGDEANANNTKENAPSGPGKETRPDAPSGRETGGADAGEAEVGKRKPKRGSAGFSPAEGESRAKRAKNEKGNRGRVRGPRLQGGAAADQSAEGEKAKEGPETEGAGGHGGTAGAPAHTGHGSPGKRNPGAGRDRGGNVKARRVAKKAEKRESPAGEQVVCPIEAGRAQLRKDNYERHTVRSLNCEVCPAGIWELKSESCPLDDVGAGPKNKRVVCAGVKSIRKQECVDWKKDRCVLHQLDLIGISARSTFGISSLAERHRVEEVAREVKKQGSRVMAYFSHMYVGRKGYMKLSANGFIVFHVYGDDKNAETDTENAIWKKWRAPKRRM